jgi:hypothetical protein
MTTVPPGFHDTHPNKYVKVHEAITRSPRVQILPQTRVWQQYADMTRGAFQSIWQGRDPRPILRDVEARAQQLIDLAASRRAARGRGARA